MELPGDLFEYKVLEKNIGKGTLCSVHKVGYGDLIAVMKIPYMIQMDATMGDDYLDGFESGIKVWEDLTKKEVQGIVRLLDHGVDPYPWFVTELISGDQLSDVLDDLPKDGCLSILSMLLDTLYYIHHFGVVHGDVRPSNIFLCEDGSVKISDWGIAGPLMDSHDKRKGIPECVRYAAPEHLDHVLYGDVDWRSDIFQLGAIYYHMLVGKPPLPSDPASALEQLKNEGIVHPGKIDPSIPTDVATAVLKALSIDKEKRWRNTTSFKKGLGLSVHQRFEEDEDLPLSQRGLATTSNLCPECGNYITAENKKLKCKDCSKFFCQTCEEWIEKTDEYQGIAIPRKFPLCDECSKKYYAQQVELAKKQIPQIEAMKRQKDQKDIERARWYGLVTPDNAVERQKLWAGSLKKNIRVKNSIGMEFAFIPPGESQMGSEEWDNTQPIHDVKIKKGFFLGIHPVTQEQWEKVMGSNPSHFKGMKKQLFKKVDVTDPKRPVENVSWDEVQRFISKLNNKENTAKYCLPTEAEWEYACRAGQGGKYCFGERKSLLGAYCWYKNNSDLRTHDIKKLKGNLWGLCDVHGNVWEWCEDWYEKEYYASSPEADPPGPSKGDKKVTRGGSWASGPDDCACGMRGSDPPEKKGPNVGFRVVMSI